jgi:tungstate transport system substrate-binding protein
MRSRLALLTPLVLLAFLVPLHSAYKGHDNDKDVQTLLAVYPALRGTAADSCATCHVSGTVNGIVGSPGARHVNHCDFCHETFVRGRRPARQTLNAFGVAYLAAGRGADAVRAIAGRDADGDGASNEIELGQGTNPGDSSSNPSAPQAPRRVVTLAELRGLSPVVSEAVFLNSTKSRSGDSYSDYRGNRLDQVLDAVGLAPEANAVDLLSADGYETTFTLTELRAAWPQGRPLLGRGREDLGACGWVTYGARGLDARKALPAAHIMLAFEENGQAFEKARVDPATGRLVGKGPLRVVVPQFRASPPDLPETADAACSSKVAPAERFHADYDHNAGKSAYAIVAIRVKPLPRGTRDVDWLASAAKTLAADQVVVFGALGPERARAGAAPGTDAPGTTGAQAASPSVLRLATTTSTADTGLLKAILPVFERECGCRVDVVAVGTGQALEIGRRGDADVVLVHARAAEDQFLSEGHARERHDVMYNDFVVVGPKADPAKISALARATEAFAAVAKAGAPFVSRGDKSGTETAEKRIWAAAGLAPAGQPWYRSLGQGMGETLVAAQELGAYTLSDRGTWLSMRDKLGSLGLLVGGATLQENRDEGLRNQYGVMAVDPDKHPGVNAAAARRFVAWLLSPAAQRAIGDFGRQRFGQSLFYPNPK